MGKREVLRVVIGAALADLRGDLRQIEAQAEAHGIPQTQVLEEVILEPHAVKRLIEPEEIAEVSLFLAGPSGRSFTGVPITMDLGWTAR